MDEKTIIEGNFKSGFKSNTLSKSLLGIGIAFVLVGLIYCAIRLETGSVLKVYFGASRYVPYTDANFDYFELLFCALIFHLESIVGILIYTGVFASLVSLLTYFMMSKCSVSVTDKRVIGKANFGKQISLPLNQISTVAQGSFSSLVVSTSAGHIHFWFLENKNEVFNELTSLICNFYSPKGCLCISENQVSDADELKKYKDLLDNGIITAEEFEAKKKQILSL